MARTMGHGPVRRQGQESASRASPARFSEVNAALSRDGHIAGQPVTNARKPPRKPPMRIRPAALLAVAATSLFATAAQAERKMFIISAYSSGYGVDRCLANGETCGAAIARTYCKSQDFATAASYRKVDREEITGSIPQSPASGCNGEDCDVVAIVCQR